VIRFDGVSFAYRGDGPPVLRGVDLSIERGERVALAGANGSGKSTLLKLMNALLLPTAGRVLVGGLDTSDPGRVWDVRRRVGLIFQNPDNQLVSTTVERELAFGMENLGLPPQTIRQRVEDASRTLSLTELLDRAPHTLSGGEKQRVAIAAVLSMEPDVLALDEPTSLLDGRGRSEVLSLLRTIADGSDRTIIHVTQFPDEIALASRAVVLSGAQVAFDGTPGELFSMGRELAAWGLREPNAARVARRLGDAGLDVPRGVLRLEELVEALTGEGDRAH
jgi:energy-coupling factor transport system ATP-binding protein